MPGASAPPPGLNRRPPELEERKQREPEGPAVSDEARKGQVEARAVLGEEMTKF